MHVHSLYPLLQVPDVEATARFYERHFGFSRVFSSDWYVQLRASADHPFEIALISQDHETIPQGSRGTTRGMILSLYVADAAAEATRLQAAGVPIAHPLRDEVFGQRHVIVTDPNGIHIDVITPIDPDPAWLAAQGAPSNA